VVILSLLGVFAATGAAAVTTNWSTNSSGVFTNPANWNNGAPGSADTAVFNRGSAVSYTASFIGSPVGMPAPQYSTDRLIVRSNSVGFARGTGVNGPSYTVNNTSLDPSGRAIIIGQQNGDVATLATTIPVSAAAATIGDAAGSSGTLDVNSNTFSLTGVVGNTFIIGNNGTGALNIEAGAKVSAAGASNAGAALAVGNNAGSVGAITVSGLGSKLQIGPMLQFVDLDIGVRGTGSLSVTNGAEVDEDGTASIADQTGSTGTATVDGPGSLWQVGRDLLLGRSGTGTLSITNGGKVNNLANGCDIGSSGMLSIDGPGTQFNGPELGVGGALNVTHAGQASVGLLAASGTVNIDGVARAWI